jgi:hypothetical protein
MTLEISRGSLYIYRIAEDDPCIVQRRRNKPNARWYTFSFYDSAEDAKLALLGLERPQPQEHRLP